MSEARSIAILLHDFAAGGTERVAVALANAWAARGRRVTILAGARTGPGLAVLDPRVALVVAAPAVSRGIGSRARLARRLAPVLRILTPDAILSPGNYHLPLAVRCAAACPESAFVAKLSNPLERADRRGLRAALFRARMRRAARRVRCFVALSAPLRAEAMRVLGPAAAVVVRADPLTIVPPPRPPRAADAPLTIGIVGRLVAQKHVALALDAFAQVADPRAQLVVVGDGPERAMLERHAAALGLRGRVTFVGHVADVAPWYARIDVLLSTSRYEGVPAVLREAVACGVPVVSTPSTPGLAALLADSGGRVVPADPVALAGAVAAVSAGPRPAHAPTDRDDAAEAWLALLDAVVAGRPLA